MTSASQYTKKVLDHFKNPRNFGEMKNPDVEVMVGNPTCGDVIKLGLKIKNNKIKDIKFQTMGCAAAIATSSMMTVLVKGKSLKEAEKLTPKDIAKALGNLPAIKFHCSTLGITALKKAIKQYLSNHN